VPWSFASVIRSIWLRMTSAASALISGSAGASSSAATFSRYKPGQVGVQPDLRRFRRRCEALLERRLLRLLVARVSDRLLEPLFRLPTSRGSIALRCAPEHRFEIDDPGSFRSRRSATLMPDSVQSNKFSGRTAFLELLKAEGVAQIFGNPGTTELPIMHALADHPDMGYVLGLQEAIVLAMADGYARASGKLAACNVHVAPGLGNAIGALYTAHVSDTPLIVTAG